ncbi:EARP-interacting protein-like isoform X2 [Centruroides sculpturatus]|uniref:EARP-interacting protein-like isoform X2 n=1 Tax=Centruroides sculpturatus TaxID=218467 RepID=UPI000C6CE909|nr:EARP-interacting protein-like isoform X2 [Centruroides sculpturatus]
MNALHLTDPRIVKMEDDAPIIYGLEFQARALCTQVAETEIARFFVGTQSLKFENQIHQLEYDEENSILSKRVFLHSAGEIWHIASSPVNSDYISTCYNHLTSDGKCEMEGAIWAIPPSKEGNDSPSDESLTTVSSVELVTKLETASYGSDVKSIVWHPVEGNQLISLVDEHILLWDVANNSQAKVCICFIDRNVYLT